MAAKSTLSNMVICLTGVCLVWAAILGAVYSVTKVPIEQASQKAMLTSIGMVIPEGGELSEAISDEATGMSYYKSVAEGKTIAYAVNSTVTGFGGPLVLMVGVLPDGTVYATKVLSQSETPGLGAQCATSESFISQFRGLGPDKKIAVRKDGGDIDAITASTITSRAYALAVSNAVTLVKTLEGQVLNEADSWSGASTKAEQTENKEEQK